MNLTVKNVSFRYQDRQVLQDVSFSLQQGSVVSLLGPNGAGKSTLFKCILGLLRNFEGSILLDGQDIRTLTPAQMALQVAYIPQAHYPAFHYSVLDMVLMGASARLSAFGVPGAKEQQAALAALELLGMADFAGRDFMKISGGEQQLVLIARAIAQNARLLIMDEPTASLDYGNQIRVMQRIGSLREKGYAVLQSTHNPNQAFLFSQQILAIKQGRLIAQGTPQQVFSADLLEQLYGIPTRVESFAGGCIRICMPS